MPLNTPKKQGTDQTAIRPTGTDTGSVGPGGDVSARVVQLTANLQQNKHDFSSLRALLEMIGRDKRLLGYLRARGGALQASYPKSASGLIPAIGRQAQSRLAL